jgi:4-alpha-glucanotransferase
MFKRESGILLHPSSFPSGFGIGDLGPEAVRWVKLLHSARQKLWQVLPLSPVGSGFSPYHCNSSFAGSAWLLSPERLHERGLLRDDELDAARTPVSRVDPAALEQHKRPLLRVAARRFLERLSSEDRDLFEAFCDAQSYWLDDFARYRAIEEARGQSSWLAWPADLVRRDLTTLRGVDRELAGAIACFKAQQFLFEEQWQSIRRMANLKGIRLIGDIPIFVSLDSADVWAAQHLFQLNPDGSPRVIAGVPPDYFSKTGQRWGNPLYDWEAHERESFAWWTRRVARTLEQTDLVRIDHFRGFAACWEIPADEPTAINGRWVPSPGRRLFQALERALGGQLPVIAEDLGIITDDVVELREAFGLPTMRVLQFSFTGEQKLLPHNYPTNCVAYTGTHDNDTTVGWYTSDPEQNALMTPAEVEAERDRVRRYFSTDGTDIQWTAIQRLMSGHTDAVIFPLQDVMGLDSSARMNTPGTVGLHNWTWRFSWDQWQPEMLETLVQITGETGRNAD